MIKEVLNKIEEETLAAQRADIEQKVRALREEKIKVKKNIEHHQKLHSENEEKLEKIESFLSLEETDYSKIIEKYAELFGPALEAGHYISYFNGDYVVRGTYGNIVRYATKAEIEFSTIVRPASALATYTVKADNFILKNVT